MSRFAVEERAWFRHTRQTKAACHSRAFAQGSRQPFIVTSVRYQYSILNLALRQAIRWQLLSSNPCAAVDPPKKEKYQAKVHIPAQLQILLDIASRTPINLPILLAVTCGLRRGEICGLRWQDVDMEKSLLFVRNSLDWFNKQLTVRPVKTSNSERSIKIPQLAMKALKDAKRQQKADKLRAGALYQNRSFCWA